MNRPGFSLKNLYQLLRSIPYMGPVITALAMAWKRVYRSNLENSHSQKLPSTNSQAFIDISRFHARRYIDADPGECEPIGILRKGSVSELRHSVDQSPATYFSLNTSFVPFPEAASVIKKLASRAKKPRYIFFDVAVRGGALDLKPGFSLVSLALADTIRGDVFLHRSVLTESCLDILSRFVDPATRSRAVLLASRPQPDMITHCPFILGYRDELQPSKSMTSGVDEFLGLLPDEAPTISVIIPFRDQVSTLKNCLESLKKTAESKFEIVLINNRSSELQTSAYLAEITASNSMSLPIQILQYDLPFNFAEICNLGAESAKGEILVFLNNDTEVISPDWLSELSGYAQREKVGAVGAQLIYSNEWIQHGGITLGLGKWGDLPHGVAGNSYRKFCREKDVDLLRGLDSPREVEAVTAACMAIRKDRFFAIGGFDANNTAIDFNDVDLCLRAIDYGYHNLYIPSAQLFHHESISRPPADSPSQAKRYRSEVEYMLEKYGSRLNKDRFYNPNLSLQFGERFFDSRCPGGF